MPESAIEISRLAGLVEHLGLVAKLRLLGGDVLLERIIDDALPVPASTRTLAFWRERWRVEDALGEALELLGVGETR